MTKWDHRSSETDICLNCVYWVPCSCPASDEDYGLCVCEESDHNRHVLGADHAKCPNAEERPRKEARDE